MGTSTESGGPIDYAAALVEQNDRFANAIRDADGSTPVPTCPGWTIEQLFRHVGRGDRWAGQIVADRMTEALDPRTVRNGKPPQDIDGTVDWLHGGVRDLLDSVAEVGADTPVWTFLGPRPAEWWIRRRLHEATVHRADAQLALGEAYELDTPLAGDCIAEWLDLLAAGRHGDELPLVPGKSLHLHGAEGGEWTIHRDGDSLVWNTGHDSGTADVSGRTVDLTLALFRRTPSDQSALEVSGDRGVWTYWLEHTAF